VVLDAETVASPPPFVEVEVVHAEARPGIHGRGWCALRVVTKNRIYDMDWGMRCFAVTDKGSGRPSPDHRLLGACLAGGQLHAGEALQLTYPIPQPGVMAVFEVGEGPAAEYTTTSEVERVVLRLSVFTLAEPEEAPPKWHALRGSLAATRPGHHDPNPR